MGAVPKFTNCAYHFFVISRNKLKHFKINTLFVNPDADTNISEKLFLGNLVNKKLEKNTDISVYTGYTFNPITVFPSVGTEDSQTFIPSLLNQENYANQILSKKPAASETFLSDWKGVVYNSHRELNLIGVGNMGVNLDEVISGKSYQEQEMTKKNGIIYSFCHTLFTLNMDMESNIVKEEINKENFPDNKVSYVSSVSYGRIGLLIIESDNDIAKIKSTVNKIQQAESVNLSAENLAILDESNVYHLYYNQSRKLKVIKGKANVIESYKKQAAEDIYNVFPFKFTLSDYFDHSHVSMTFEKVLP